MSKTYKVFFVVFSSLYRYENFTTNFHYKMLLQIFTTKFYDKSFKMYKIFEVLIGESV